MDLQNLAYALNQLVHNAGAVSVVAASAVAVRWPEPVAGERHRTLSRAALAGWTLQGLSGAGFGAISHFYYGRFPDIHGIAVGALFLKMACAVGGFAVCAALMTRGAGWSAIARQRCYGISLVLAATALGAAAFLRWFS